MPRQYTAAAYAKLQPKTTQDRFWAHVAQHPTGCWEWRDTQATRQPPQFRGVDWQGIPMTMKAQDYSWAIHYGHLPISQTACNVCGNPRCVRPDHLERRVKRGWYD